MFHHQKSSKQSDEDLEINLLKKQHNKRDSRVNFNRVRDFELSSPLRRHQTIKDKAKPSVDPSHRSQVLREPSDRSDDDNIVISDMEKYPTLPHNRWSQSMLTDSNNNNKFVGFLLFAILLVFTPLQALTFIQFQPLQQQNPNEVLINLLLAEIIAFIILYNANWIQKIKLKKQLFRTQRRSKQDNSMLTKIYHLIFDRPVLAIIAIYLITYIWQISYMKCIMNTVQGKSDEVDVTPIQLIFLYITLLPQISTFLYYEDSFLSSKYRKRSLIIIICYLLIVGILVDPWLGLTCFSGILLIVLSITMGRIVTYLEYFSKTIFVIYLFVIKIFFSYQDYQQYQDQPGFFMRLFIILLMAGSILIVRCINNKILRNQLYKYYYTDSFINCALLLLPPFIGFFDDFQQIQYVLLAYLGVLGLIVTSYMVGKDRYEVKMQGGAFNLNDQRGNTRLQHPTRKTIHYQQMKEIKKRKMKKDLVQTI